MKLSAMQEKRLLAAIAEAKNGSVPGKAEATERSEKAERTERSERSWFRK